jgi:hypothetical protein
MENKIQIAIEEYKAIWSYYQKSIDERFNLFSWYFKVVTLPAAVLGFITIIKPEINSEVIDYAVFGILTVIFLTGISLHITYAKQCRNASKLESSLRQLRAFFRTTEPTLESVLIFDKLRQGEGFNIFKSVKFWRGMVFSIINSAVFSGAIAILLYPYYWLIILSYLLSLILHIMLYRLCFKTYLNKGAQA